MPPQIRRFTIPAILLSILASWQLPAQQTDEKGDGAAKFAKPGTRFEFEVVESFDAKYLGDTPGHTGQAGGLGSTRPQVALGDAVYRGKESIGTVTGVVWSHARGSLTVEFDPKPYARIAVGEIVWVELNPAAAPKKDE